jgi:hypothetical protein
VELIAERPKGNGPLPQGGTIATSMLPDPRGRREEKGAQGRNIRRREPPSSRSRGVRQPGRG